MVIDLHVELHSRGKHALPFYNLSRTRPGQSGTPMTSVQYVGWDKIEPVLLNVFHLGPECLVQIRDQGGTVRGIDVDPEQLQAAGL